MNSTNYANIFQKKFKNLNLFISFSAEYPIIGKISSDFTMF